MSDDFDKDDLWDDDDQPDKNQSGDDEEIFDWQQGGKPGDKSRKDEDRLGFTGELSWMQDDDEGNAPGQGDDRLGLTGELPWLQGEDDTPITDPRDSAAGLTGALPWMQGAAGGTGEQADPDDDFSWLDDDDESPPADMNTGSLFMPPTDEPDDEPPAEDVRWTGEHVTADLDMPDWMRDSGPDWIDDENADAAWDAPAASMPWGDDPTDEPASAFDEDAPDWLTGTDSLSTPADEPAEPEIPPVDKESPEWLQKFDTSNFGEPPPAADTDDDDPLNAVPDWLAGLDDDEPAQEDTSFTQGGQLSADWLAQGETLPETSESDLTFDEWLQQQEEQEREPELDELVPDTFDNLGDLTAEPPVSAEEIDTGMLPDWFLGMEELDTSDAPDWFTDDLEDETAEPAAKDPTEPNKPTGPLPDMFGFDDFPDDTTQDDPFSGLDEPAEPATLEDFLTPVEVEDLDDLVEVDVVDAEEQPAAEVDLDADFFSTLGDLPDETTEPDFADFDFPEAETTTEADDDYADDFFSSLGAAAPADDLPEPTLDDFGPDFAAALGLGDDEPAAPEPQPAPDVEPLSDDFFASLGLDDEPDTTAPEGVTLPDDDLDALFSEPASEPEFYDESTIPDGEFLSSLGIADDEPDEEPIDWFAEAENEIATDAEAMGWLDDIGEYDEDAAEPVDADFMASLGATPADQPTPESEYDDIDSILASIDRVDAILPDSSPLMQDNVDFDTLMSDPAFSDLQGQRENPQDAAPPQEDWLTELGASVGTVSAAAIVRQQQDRPVDQLSDRLRRLRDKAEDTPAAEEAASSPIIADLLPGINTTLAASSIELDASSIAGSIIITPEQQKRIDLLKSLAATEAELEQPALSAIDRTYDSPYMLDDDDDLPGLLDDDQPAEEVKVAPVARPREPRRVRVDRLLIALLVAAAVIAPFFLRQARIGQPPPATFANGSPALAFYETVARLRPGQFVLVGMEYGPTAAGELDTSASVVLRHILQQGAHPVVVSSNPVALLRADNLLTQIAADSTPALTANDDYYVIRYLAGNSVGLRGFSQNPLALLATDIQGAPTGLTRVDDLADFSAVIVIAERAEDLRTWAEQVAPLTRVAFLGVTGFSAAPMTEPYLGAALDGLLIGYQDALTYDVLLASGAVALPPATDTDESAPGDDTGTDETDLTPTLDVTPSPQPPTPTPTPVALGVINATNSINVREGAGPGFAVVTSLDPGTEVTVLSLDDSAGWVNVRLPDGTEGWVSSSLIVVLPTGATATIAAETEAPAATTTPLPTGTPAPTETRQPSPTANPTQTAAPTQTQRPTSTATIAPSSTPTTGPTNTPLATTITARVIATESINIRSGPGTTFAPVGTAAPGDEFVVVGRNGAGDWISIEFGDAEEAWIAAFLLEISAAEIPPADDDTSQAGRDLVLVAGSDLRLVPYRAQAETTPEAEATAEVTAAAETAGISYTIPYAEERWYSMNLGLAAIIVIIVLGALINIGRAVFRRRG